VKLSAKQIRIHCLHDAIHWESSFLNCIKHCTDESSKKARDLGEKLLIEYRKQLLRISGSDHPPILTGTSVEVVRLLKLSSAAQKENDGK
jgi:hypothetical protein